MKVTKTVFVVSVLACSLVLGSIIAGAANGIQKIQAQHLTTILHLR